jgi:glycosyltransferase involved in cell wall biosynthesis
MSPRQKFDFLFVSAPFSGIEVFMKNLRDVVDRDDSIRAEWLFLEKESPELFSHIPPVSLNWTLRGGLVARKRIHTLEHKVGRFHAALFNHIIPATFIDSFRHRTPIVLSLDATPVLLNRYAAWYLNNRKEGPLFVRQMKKSITRRVYQEARLILPWSKVVEGSLVCDYGIPREKMEVVPPGIDLAAWKCAHSGARSRRAGNFRVLFVGGDFERKGGDILLEIARREDFQGTEFHFVTNAEVSEPPQNAYFHRNVTPNSKEIIALYREADLFALPTRADLSPNAICEAMAAGVPILATDVGGISEMVKNDMTGYLVPPYEPDEFATALKMFIHDRPRLQQMGKAARRIAEERFNLETNSNRIIQLLKEIAAEQTGSGILNPAR